MTDDVSAPPPPLRIAFRLTEADVRRYLASGRYRACRRVVRDQCWGLAMLGAIGGFLVGACFHGRGVRAGLLASGGAMAVFAAFVWWRDARAGLRACRLARDWGIPRDLRLEFSTRGIAKAPGPDPSDPGRRFTWAEVRQVRRSGGATTFELGPAAAILIVPDRAAGPDLARWVEDWRSAAD